MQTRHVTTWTLGLLAALVVLAPPAAVGEIVSFQGKVTTTAQEGSGVDFPGSDVDSAEFPHQSDPVAIESMSELFTRREGLLAAHSRGLAAMLDPTGSQTRNPGEYQFELGAFSNLPEVAYVVRGHAVEGRRVRFTAADRGAAALFGGGVVNSVESSVFVGTTLLFWSTAEDVSLEGGSAVLNVRVVDSRLAGGDSDGAVMRLSLTFAGTSAGRVRVDAAQVTPENAPLLFDILTLPALRGLADDDPAATGADPLFIEYAARLVEQADAFGIRTLAAVFVPDQEFTYSYALEADRTFELEAQFELVLTNAPDGVGAAAVMGRPFEALEAMLEESVTGIDGGQVQEAVNQLAKLVAADVARQSSPPPAGFCGAIGPVGLSGLAASLIGLSLSRGRSKRRRVRRTDTRKS